MARIWSDGWAPSRTDDSERPRRPEFGDLQDGGTRTRYGDGAMREAQPGKGRYDLLWMHAMQRVAVVFEKGAAKYEERNWEKGMPLHRYYDSAMRHLIQYATGDTSEDHLAQALWNIGCLIDTEHWINEGVLPEELRDMPVHDKGDGHGGVHNDR